MDGRRWAVRGAFSLLPSAFLAVMVVAPLWAVAAYDGLAWRAVLSDAYMLKRLAWTVFQAAATCVLVLPLGVPVAWVLARLAFPGRALVLRLLMLPFVMPTLVAGVGVLALFGADGLLWRGRQDTPYLLLYGNVFFNLPVLVRAAYQGFAQVPAARLQTARTLGAGAWRRFWDIEMPVLRPWLAGGVCLVFLYCFSGFGLALLLGGSRYATVEVEIYQLVMFELDMAGASALVWLVLGVTAAAGLLYAWFGRRAVSDKAVSPVMPSPPQSVGEYVLLAFSVAVLSVCCLFPLSAIVVKAWSAGESRRVLMESETWQAVWNTLRFSAAAVFAAAVLGVVYAAAAGVDARTGVFTVYGVAGLCFGGRAAALSGVDGFVTAAAGDVCAAGVSVCGKRCFIGLGCTAAGLRQGGGRFGRKRLSDGMPYHVPPLETGVAARSDFGGGDVCGRICGNLVPVASGMADVDDFDLCLFGACG